MKLSDELRQQLLENAAWGKAGITPRLDEVVEVTHPSGKKYKVTDKQAKNRRGHPATAKEQQRTVTGSEAGLGTTKDILDRRAAIEKSLKAGTEYEDADGAEELEEAIHVCPLCISQLDESIDEERILEHLNVVVGLVDRLSHLEEGDEDIETVIDNTIQELLFQDVDEE